MYLVTKYDVVKYQGDSLVDFLYQYFEFEIENGNIKIRDKNYQVYINKDFYIVPTSYSKDWTKKEMIVDFIKNYFIEIAKQYYYEFYKCEKL